jgi:phage shock protein PspC (stress-responsive transcriptional regulator)
MKRVETIHINGIVFSIDDDAFGKLSSYLNTLSKYFEKEQGGAEIIADIEARISELFTVQEKVITLADVTKVIETLGTPEDIAGADAGAESNAVPPPRTAQHPPKSSQRLYRDPDKRYLGGVCSGIAAWLGVTPLAIRLVFFVIAVFYGISLAVYFLLWIFLPKAKTTAQKLEMRGEPVNISNIEKNIRETLSDPTLKRSFRNFLDEAGEVFSKFFYVFGRLIGILLGLFLFFWGICFAITLTGLFFMQDIIFNHFVEWDLLSFTELFRHIISPTAYSILLFCAILIAILFVFALLFWGSKLIVGSTIKHRLVHVALTVLWITAIVTIIITGISQARNFAWHNDQMVETRQLANADTLYLSLATSKLQISNNPMEIYFDKDSSRFYGKPNLYIQKSNNEQIWIKFDRNSQGESKRAAYRYAESIDYLIDVHDSSLRFDPYFTVSPPDKWKFQTLDVFLYVPEGTVIIADQAFCRNFRWYLTANHSWVMTEKDGLERND